MPTTTQEKLRRLRQDAERLQYMLHDSILQEDIQRTLVEQGLPAQQVPPLEILKRIARDFDLDGLDDVTEPVLLQRLKHARILNDGDHRLILENTACLSLEGRQGELSDTLNEATNNGANNYPEAGQIKDRLVRKLCASFEVEITRHDTVVSLIQKLKDARALNDSDVRLFDLEIAETVRNENKPVFLHTAEEGELRGYAAAMVQIVFGGSRGRTSPNYETVNHLHVDGVATDNLIFTLKDAGAHFLGIVAFHMENGLDDGKRLRITAVHNRHTAGAGSFARYKLYKRNELEADDG